MKRAMIALLVVVGVAAPSTASARLSHQQIIARVFAPEGAGVAGQAVRVAGCESAGDPTGHVIRPWATNGQFLGAFQLGDWARGRFLDGPWFGLWANARAALRLYRSNGRSWRGQWSCSWAA